MNGISEGSKPISNANREFELVQRTYKQKLNIKFLDGHLRKRGKNGFEALDEINRYVFLNFENYVSMMIVKQHLVFLIPFYNRDSLFYNRDYPGSYWYGPAAFFDHDSYTSS